jgi:hypothetical protein
MKPEDQRIALAEWDGWKLTTLIIEEDDAVPSLGIYPGENVFWTFNGRVVRASAPPDYLNDLNAIRPLLLKLDPRQQKVFAVTVECLVESGKARTFSKNAFVDFIEAPSEFIFQMLTLSPELLCKALLKTLRLWK